MASAPGAVTRASTIASQRLARQACATPASTASTTNGPTAFAIAVATPSPQTLAASCQRIISASAGLGKRVCQTRAATSATTNEAATATTWANGGLSAGDHPSGVILRRSAGGIEPRYPRGHRPSAAVAGPGGSPLTHRVMGCGNLDCADHGFGGSGSREDAYLRITTSQRNEVPAPSEPCPWWRACLPDPSHPNHNSPYVLQPARYEAGPKVRGGPGRSCRRWRKNGRTVLTAQPCRPWTVRRPTTQGPVLVHGRTRT